MTTSHHNASRHARLILIGLHRFHLELLFHNHRSLPIPFVATIYEPAYFTRPSLHFFEPFVPIHLPPSLSPLPLALTLYPLYLSLPSPSSPFPYLRTLTTTPFSIVRTIGWRRGVVVSGVRQWTKLTHVGPGYNWDG